MLFFGTKPVARLRNGNASVKGKVLAHFQVVNQGELGRGGNTHITFISENAQV